MARKPVTSDKHLHIRVTESQLERWKSQAEKELLTLSDWIRKNLDEASK